MKRQWERGLHGYVSLLCEPSEAQSMYGFFPSLRILQGIEKRITINARVWYVTQVRQGKLSEQRRVAYFLLPPQSIRS